MNGTNVIGIHVLGNTFRLAELCRSGGHPAIVRLVEEQIESGGEGGEPGGFCVTAMPTSDVMTRCFTLPESNPAQFDQMVRHRLEADLPLPIDQLKWGYRKHTQPSPAGPVATVMAQAARAQRVAEHTARLGACGMNVGLVTTEAQAIDALYHQALRPTDASGAQLLILSMPEQWLVAAICDAAVYAVRYIDAPPDHLDQPVREVHQVIATSDLPKEIRRVRWCGPREPAAARDALAEVISVPVESVEPTTRLVHGDGRPLDINELATFGPAIGLALTNVASRDGIVQLAAADRTEPTRGRMVVQRLLRHPWRWTAAAVALLVVAAGTHVAAIKWETQDMRALLEESARAPAIMPEQQDKVRAMYRLKTYRIDVEAIVADLCRPIPKNIIISSMQLSRGRHFIVKGTSKDPKAIFALAEALRKGDRFVTVTPGRTEPGRGGGFTITADLAGIEVLPAALQRGAAWR